MFFMISLFRIFLLLTMLLPLAIQGQKPDRELLPPKQLIFDQIFSRLEPALINYYNGHPLAYGALFHNDGIYAGQINRYSGEAEINKTFARWEGETKFNAKISDAQFMVLDLTKALLAYNVQEDDHTLWLGSEVWTKKDGNWGLSYALGLSGLESNNRTSQKTLLVRSYRVVVFTCTGLSGRKNFIKKG